MISEHAPARREGGGARLVAALALAFALTAVSGPTSAAARQEVSAPTDGEGWLGVGLISFSECLEGPDVPEDECRHTLVVGGLVHGGPADRAGVEAGDTLVAVGSTRLDGGLEDRSFGRLNPGDTVPVVVGRPDGRVQLEVVPTARPDSLAIVRYHRDGPHLEDGSHYLLAIRERRAIDSLVSSASRDPNVTVRTRVSVVPTERVKKIPLRPGTGASAAARAEARERLAEMRARRRQLQRQAVEEVRELRERAREAPPAPLPPDAEEWKRWVAEELQPRLQVIYDSVLAVARDRMDSLRALYPGAAARAAEAMDSLSAAARAVEAREPPAATPPPGGDEVPPSPEALGMAGNRIAGAELQPLTPELGEFFGDVERGLVVLEVLRGTPAARLGLQPGDVIVEAAGHPVTTVRGLRHALTEHASGVVIRWIRRGRSMADTLRH